MLRRALLILASLLPLIAAPAAGQVRPGGSVGTAIPNGSAAHDRSAGPWGHLSVTVPVTEHLSLQGVAGGGVLVGREPTSDGAFSTGDLRVLHVGAEMALGHQIDEWRVLAVLGPGRWWLKDLGGTENPYGATWGATLGAGAERAIGSLALTAGVRQQIIFSDFGADDYAPTTLVALTLGVRYPARRAPQAPPWRSGRP